MKDTFHKRLCKKLYGYIKNTQGVATYELEGFFIAIAKKILRGLKNNYFVETSRFQMSTLRLQ